MTYECKQGDIHFHGLLRYVYCKTHTDVGYALQVRTITSPVDLDLSSWKSKVVVIVPELIGIRLSPHASFRPPNALQQRPGGHLGLRRSLSEWRTKCGSQPALQLLRWGFRTLMSMWRLHTETNKVYKINEHAESPGWGWRSTIGVAYPPWRHCSHDVQESHKYTGCGQHYLEVLSCL